MADGLGTKLSDFVGDQSAVYQARVKYGGTAKKLVYWGVGIPVGIGVAKVTLAGALAYWLLKGSSGSAAPAQAPTGGDGGGEVDFSTGEGVAE